MACPTKFKPYNKLLRNVVKEVSLGTMKEAVTLESVESEEGLTGNAERNLTIAFDGSLQKRGHSFQNGMVSAISVNTGKVIDVEVLSKACRSKNRLDKVLDETCTANNYKGSSSGMEVVGVSNMFLRSQELHNVKYNKYLGDGDTSAYATIASLKPYGPNFTIEKLECVGHVQKRMGTRLRNLKSKSGKQKLSDGLTIGGRGRLTGSAIQRITTFYGLAIRRNVSSLEK